MKGARKLLTESGHAALEMAVTMPFWFIMIVGLSNLGFIIRETQLISDSTRHGARTAASFANSGMSCIDIKEEAGKFAKNYLQQSGIDSADWAIKPEIKTVTGFNPSINVLEISIKPAGQTNCLICAQNFLSLIDFKTSSSFALEGTCS
ncbi:hypothetical protein JNK13_02040 [bacterium]|nr:hypothetical protein [bacterium]